MAGKHIFRSLVVGLTIIGIASTPFLSPAGKQAQAASTEQGTPIRDSLIQEGWNNLHSCLEPIQMPNGEMISGQLLADFIITNQIPVVWGSDDICGGSSCSILYCYSDGNCSYENGQPGVEPIYINPAVQYQDVGQMLRLTKEIAHEAFHRMRYFGQVSDSQLEEYWAFYVGTQVVMDDWPNFDGVDPQNPDQLQSWFKRHALNGYLNLPLYPGDPAPDLKKTEANQAIVNLEGK